jgi:hypothetical protein
MAYDFNGTSQYLYTTSVPVTNFPLTMCAWFYPDSLNGYHALVNLSSEATVGYTIALDARGGDAGDPVSAVDYRSPFPAGFIVANTTVPYATGTWQHAAAVFTSNASRTVYLDGGNAVTNTSSNTDPFRTYNRVGIGVYFSSNNTPFSYLDGRIAEVGIWNAALTAAEVASLAKGMTCDKVRPQSLVFYAPLVRDLQDVRGGLTITNNNAATVATHPRVYA